MCPRPQVWQKLRWYVGGGGWKKAPDFATRPAREGMVVAPDLATLPLLALDYMLKPVIQPVVQPVIR